MTGPTWLSAALAAVTLLIAACSAVRLASYKRGNRAGEPEVDALHLLMGVAMAGMLEPGITPVPDVAWRVVFAAAAVWFTWRSIRSRQRKPQPTASRSGLSGWRCAHPAPHAVECGAMIYMLLPVRGHAAAVAMPGMTGTSAANPAASLVLALFMIGYIFWTADRLTSQLRSRDAWAATGGAALARRAAAFATIAMSLAMGYMLLTMM